MKVRRTLKMWAALALVLPLLAIAGPAEAQRRTSALAAAPSGLGRAYVPDVFGGVVHVIDIDTNTNGQCTTIQ